MTRQTVRRNEKRTKGGESWMANSDDMSMIHASIVCSCGWMTK